MFGDRNSQPSSNAPAPPHAYGGRVNAQAELALPLFAGNTFLVDGSATIRKVGSFPRSVPIFLLFTGTCTLVNSTTFLLPGGINQTVGPGDSLWLIHVGDGAARVVEIQRSSGQAATLTMHGQCRLVLSGANLLLKPLDGNRLIVNGVPCTVPDAGVTLGVGAVSAGTNYNIYAVATAGVITSLEASTTGHSTSTTAGNNGVEIKTGDDTRTLVGLARPIGGPAWADTGANRLVISWFNRRRKISKSVFTAQRSTLSATYVELNTEIRVNVLVWSDEDTEVICNGWNTTVSAGINSNWTTIGFDGVTPEDGGTASSYSNNALAQNCCVTAYKSGLAEGYHFATILGRTSDSVSGGQWSGSATPGERCSLTATIRG